MPAERELRELARRITSKLFRRHDGTEADRLELRVGPWPDDERADGGYCFASAENAVLDELRGFFFPTAE
jgi:hypothetical protein